MPISGPQMQFWDNLSWKHFESCHSQGLLVSWAVILQLKLATRVNFWSAFEGHGSLTHEVWLMKSSWRMIAQELPGSQSSLHCPLPSLHNAFNTWPRNTVSELVCKVNPLMQSPVHSWRCLFFVFHFLSTGLDALCDSNSPAWRMRSISSFNLSLQYWPMCSCTSL